ncbi:GNAT family N-acetyltransferase [Emticicia sp. 17c]|uniref:GNAT family N-acetyltransferase n=1 Tax=Emticicia sp. 17c TaxID=3127704 RepID=UPI00301CBCD8
MTDNLHIRFLEAKDFDKLLAYLTCLSAETRSRFAPHTFDMPTIEQFYQPENNQSGFIIENLSEHTIVAYAIIKKGYVPKDKARLQKYGLSLFPLTDCTFAPSVADAWQGKGLGNTLFGYIRHQLQMQGLKRMILWGGVQAQNVRAVNFYLKQGFLKIGDFENNGIANYDMILEI